MAGQVFEHAGTLTILVRSRFLEDACPEISRSSERCIDIRNSDLDDVHRHAATWCDLIGANVGDNDGAVRSNAQLSAMPVADAYPFPKAERGLQPRYGRSHIRIDQHRSHRGGRRGAIRKHGG
jgi:hypothetical protein